jgi:tRNA(fMet)-specific endonuclease VapC
MVTHLLDTNTCIYIINQRPPEAIERFRELALGAVGISSITVGELVYGISKGRSSKNRMVLENFLLPLAVMPFDTEASWKYGEVRQKLEQKGTPIGPLDTLIAAHALSLGATLVTNNLKEFARVEGLELENWVG